MSVQEKTFIQELGEEDFVKKVNREYVAHLRESHHGKPQTSCHTCMTYESRVQMAEEIQNSSKYRRLFTGENKDDAAK